MPATIAATAATIEDWQTYVPEGTTWKEFIGNEELFNAALEARRVARREFIAQAPLEELFASADQIGNKYQAPEKLGAEASVIEAAIALNAAIGAIDTAIANCDELKEECQQAREKINTSYDAVHQIALAALAKHQII